MDTFKKRVSQFLSMAVIIALLGLISCGESEKTIEPENLPEDNLPDISGYPIASTNQTLAYNARSEISMPKAGDSFFGQDANYKTACKYEDNGDGTVTDLVTGLMWQQSADMNGDGKINASDKLTYDAAVQGASSFELGGYTDWRLPTIKELYSLIIFSGEDPSGVQDASSANLVPFIDTDYFGFGYGDESAGERIIDAQFVTSTLDVGDTQFGGGNLMFGVNFGDGRIKGYPTGSMPGQSGGKEFYVYYVRGNTDYGKNDFENNGDGTVTDKATGLMWIQDDSGTPLSWEVALSYAEGKEFAGHTDWRLPSVKELQSIVDYTRAPGATNSAAIDPIFNCTKIVNEGGQDDYGFYWSATTHANSQGLGTAACYVSFGRALGNFNGQWMDVHGAGAQRSDPKTGNVADYPTGHGPQGDAIRILNQVRLVRSVN